MNYRYAAMSASDHRAAVLEGSEDAMVHFGNVEANSSEGAELLARVRTGLEMVAVEVQES